MIYELRIDTVHPGRMGALQARFRDHTCALFERHGMTNVGYWVNTIGGRSDELWYILGYDDLAARRSAWAAFRADPEWQRWPRSRRPTARSCTTSRTGCSRPPTSPRSL